MCKNMDIVSNDRHVFIFSSLQVFSHKLHKEMVGKIEATGKIQIMMGSWSEKLNFSDPYL